MADEARMRRLLDEAAAFAASDAFQSADGWDRLLELNEHALEAAPLETSYHGMIANQLAELLGTRAGMTGDPAHWRAAQSRVKDLLGTVPEDDWRFPLYVLADGAMHYRRAVASGNSEHIDPALTRLEGARRLVRRGSGISLTAAAYLSELYYRRYAVTRDRLDLESAISAGFAVGEGTPRPKERVLAMTILAGALGSRYELTHDPTDVEVAVAFAEDAVAEAEGREAIRAARGARATARRLRFRVRGDRNDLDDAIADYESVLTLTDDPRMSGSSWNFDGDLPG